MNLSKPVSSLIFPSAFYPSILPSPRPTSRRTSPDVGIPGVRRDVGAHVARLGLDHRQRRQRATAVGVLSGAVRGHGAGRVWRAVSYVPNFCDLCVCVFCSG